MFINYLINISVSQESAVMVKIKNSIFRFSSERQTTLHELATFVVIYYQRSLEMNDVCVLLRVVFTRTSA